MTGMSLFSRVGIALTVLVSLSLLLPAGGLSLTDEANAQSETASQDTAAEQETMWLGHVLVYRYGAPVVERVADPVEGAGLQPGDVITAIGETPVYTPEEVKEQVEQIEVGKKVILVFRRGPKTHVSIFPRPDPTETSDAEDTR